MPEDKDQPKADANIADIKPADTPPLDTKSAAEAPKDSEVTTEPTTESVHASTPSEVDSAAPATPSATVTTMQTKPSPLRRLLLWAVATIVLVIGGVYGYQYYQDQTNVVNAPVAKKDIDRFVYGVIAGPLDLFYPESTIDVDSAALNQQIFEGLVTYRDKKIVPNLAESWTNPDASTWVFTLKSGVTFHTGRTMAAADVKYSLTDAVKDTVMGELYASTIESVEVVDTTTVQITTSSPDPILLNKLVFLYIVDSQAEGKASPANGTGPYTIKPGTTATAEAVDLVAFDDYHGGHVGVRELGFRVFGDDAAMSEALSTGKVNLASFSDVAEADKIKDQFTPFYLEDPTVFGLMVNTADGPLADAKVREAIYTAIDATALLKNTGIPGTVATQIVVKDIPGYDPAITRPAYNVTKAKQLLTEAGYPNGIEFSVTHRSGISLLEKISTELKSQLAAADITLTVNALSREELGKLAPPQIETMLIGGYSDLLDASDVYAGLVGSPFFPGEAIMTSLETANTTTDPAARLKLMQEVSSQLMKELPFIPLYNGAAPYLLSSESYTMPIDIPATAYPGVYFWRVYE